jgi:hypothetical protein
MAPDSASAPPAQYPMPSQAWQSPPGYPYPYPWPPAPAQQPNHAVEQLIRDMREDLKAVATKVDELRSDHVRQVDLDALRRELKDEFARAEARSYSRTEADAKFSAYDAALKTVGDALGELKTTVGTQAERQLSKLGAYIAIGVGLYTLARALRLIP